MQFLYVLSLFTFLSLPLAKAEEPEVPTDTEEGAFVPNPDIQTLVYYAAPEVSFDVRNAIQEVSLNVLFETSQSPDAYLGLKAKGPEEKVLASKTEEVQGVSEMQKNIESALRSGLMGNPGNFAFLFDGTLGSTFKTTNIKVLFFVPNLKDPTKEYRVVIESPARKLDGSEAMNITEALNETTLMEYKVIQAIEVPADAPLSDLENKIVEEKHAKLYKV